MKKKIFNLHPGFNIPELLMSMLVVMLVAAAIVPMIGPKKIKMPKFLTNKGVYECYWGFDEDGNTVLKEYFADNNGKTITGPNQIGGGKDYCEFTPPKSGRYEIYVVGAGTPGMEESESNISRLDFSLNQELVGSGNIRLTKMQQDINEAISVPGVSLPTLLREEIDDWAYNNGPDGSHSAGEHHLFARIEKIVSPIGYAGNSQAFIYRSNTVDCETLFNDDFDNYLRTKELKYSDVDPGSSNGYFTPTSAYSAGDLATLMTTNDKCYYYYFNPGEASAKGAETTAAIDFPIDSSTSVSIQQGLDKARVSTNTRFEVYGETNHLVEFPASQSGRDSNGYPSGTTVVFESLPGTGPIDLMEEDDKIISSGLSSEVTLKNGDQNFPWTFWSPSVVDHVLPLTPLQFGGLVSIAPDPHEGTPGVVYCSASSNCDDIVLLQWEYYGLKGQAVYGKGGYPGTERVFHTPKMEGKFYLHPGRYDSATGEYSQSIITKNDDFSKTDDFIGYVSSIPDGVDAAMLTSDDVQTSEYFDYVGVPIPAQGAVIDNANHMNLDFSYVGKTNFERSELTNCDSSLLGCPGYAGPGYYPILSYDELVGVRPQIKLNKPSETKRTWNVGGEIPSEEDFSAAADDCGLKGARLIEAADGKKYCKTGDYIRRDGAIIIVWY